MSHFYDLQGNPVYEVPCSTKEGMRPTTIKDARKLNLVPSVTEIINIPDKYFLRKWQIEQTLNAAWNNKKKLLTEIEWKDLVLKESNKISDNSKQLGSKIHDSLEQYFKSFHLDLKDTFNLEYINPAIQVLLKNCSRELYVAEKSFAHELGFGGKVDLHGEDFVLDFKTKDKEWEDGEGKSLVYDTHVMQLAAYREGLNLPCAKCYNLFISTKKPGLVYLHEWKETEVQRGWSMFKCLLQYWRLVCRV